MKTKITFFLLFLSVCFINAQTFQWAKTWGNPGSFSDVGNGVAVDGAGNVYSTGFYASVADFDPGPGTFTLSSNGGSTDIFISKLDAAGNFVWAASIGGTGSLEAGYAITVDALGNVCVTGYFQGTADFDPGAGSFPMTAASQSDIFVLKLSAAGNFIWAKSFGAFSADYGYGIKTDASGNIYTTGSYNQTVDFDPGAGTFNLTSLGSDAAFVSKLDASGNFVWAKSIDGPNSDIARSLSLDASGNVLITGNFNTTVDFDPGASTYTLTSGGSNDPFIVKLNSAGNFVWAKNLSGTGQGYGYGITTDASGNVYSTGRFVAMTDFDPGAGTFTLTPNGLDDIYISKLDASGNFLWAKNMGGSITDFGYSVATDAVGNVYFCGTFQGSVDFDPGAATFSLGSSGGADVFICNLDPAGNFIWAGNMGGSVNDYGYAITVDGTNNIYTTGYFSNTCDFDPNAGTFTVTSNGGPDAFVVKLNALGTNISKAENLNDGYLLIYPNPSNGQFKLSSSEDFTGVVSVIDVMGREILKQELKGAKEIELNITVKGLYFVRFENEQRTSVKKLVIE